MITTITTSSITTITSITTIAAMGLTAAIGIVAVVGLIAFLTTKEVASVSRFRPALRIAKFVNVGIVPLVIAFAVIVAVTILEALG